MNYGNPHQNAPTRFLPPLGNRGMGRERKEKPILGKPGPWLDGQETIYKPGPYLDGQETIYRPLSAGFDGGNRRPIYDRNGGLVRQRPVIGEKFKMPVPVPFMDYKGSRTASMDPGSKYNGTYKQEGYGDPRNNDFGQDEYYDNRDYYMDDVIDPGLSGYDRGPLYFS